MTALKFIYTYVVFLFFVTFMISLGAPSFMSTYSIPEPPEPPDVSGWTAVFDIIYWAVQNWIYFFELMMVSSEIRAVGILILSPLVFILIWILISFARGVST